MTKQNRRWLELWAIARYDLHLTESEFWQLTPAQYYALIQRHNTAIQLDNERFANLMALFANAHRDTKKHPQEYTAADFGGRTEKPEQTSMDHKSAMMSVTKHFEKN